MSKALEYTKDVVAAALSGNNGAKPTIEAIDETIDFIDAIYEKFKDLEKDEKPSD
jgi:hypothetical protein